MVSASPTYLLLRSQKHGTYERYVQECALPKCCHMSENVVRRSVRRVMPVFMKHSYQLPGLQHVDRFTRHEMSRNSYASCRGSDKRHYISLFCFCLVSVKIVRFLVVLLPRSLALRTEAAVFLKLLQPARYI